MSLHTRAAIAAAHYIIAPANPSALADPGLHNLFDTIDAMRALVEREARVVGCVATNWEKDKKIHGTLLAQLQDDVLSKRGVTLFDAKIPHDARIDEAHLSMGRGGVAYLFGVRGAAAAYDKLLEEVLNVVSNA
jgi:cellulose biosynthesis protein BcsQ